MLITNSAKYSKDYRILAAGNARLILKLNVMIAQYESISIVYKNNILLGCNNSKSISSRYDSTYIMINEWDKRIICGYWCTPHNIPYYERDPLTYNIYGFVVTQHGCFIYGGGMLNANTYDNLMQI